MARMFREGVGLSLNVKATAGCLEDGLGSVEAYVRGCMCGYKCPINKTLNEIDQ